MHHVAQHSSRIVVVSAVFLALPILACADNATKVTFGIERVLEQVAGVQPSPTTANVPYRPVRRADAPYTLVFFPPHRVTPDDLQAAGLSRPVTDEIFRRLDYLDVGSHEMLVAIQDGVRLNFTTSFRPLAKVEDLLILRGVGTRELLLVRKGERWVTRGWADPAPDD